MADPASWHSHIYFDADSHPRAEALVASMKAHFGADAGITYGRWHPKPVGPHPDFSIQLEFPHELFAAVTTFLALNRGGLTIFTHPNTGTTTADELRDHRDHAVWMGAVRPLKLSLFGGEDQR
jgi:aromatic ring-cleaving dioxygenase